MTPLRQRMLEDLQLRNYSPTTVRIYMHAVTEFARHFGKPPDQLNAEHIRQYQIFLIKEKKVSQSTFVQVVCALRFFYTHTLNRKIAIDRIPFPRRERKLPLILSRDEVRALLEAPRSLRHRTMLAILYASGLRVSEVARLKVADIDRTRNVLWVRSGKGRKDRQALLPPKLRDLLRCYWRSKRPTGWLFPAPIRTSPSRRKPFSSPAATPRTSPASQNRFTHIHCGTPSPRTYWKPAWIFAPSRLCSATPISQPRRAICKSPTRLFVPLPVRSNRSISISFRSSDARASAGTGRCLPHSPTRLSGSLELRAFERPETSVAQSSRLPDRGPGRPPSAVRPVRASRHLI